MKHLVALLFVTMLASSVKAETNTCRSLGQLATAITNAYAIGDSQAMASLKYTDSVPAEIVAYDTMGRLPYSIMQDSFSITNNVEVKVFDAEGMAMLMNKDINKDVVVPADVMAFASNFLSALVPSATSLPITNVQIKAFADHLTPASLPGEYNGKQLEWFPAPSHWIIVSSGVTENGITREAKAEFAVAMKNQVWWIVGKKYKESPNAPDGSR